ncbi:MAG: signal transduction histidine kinase [Chlamydiales bacterium]
MNLRGKSRPDSFFATKRTALFLYSLLVVLPALVFGTLHWSLLIEEHRAQLSQAPEDASSAVTRMLGEIKHSLKVVLDREERRDFRQYQQDSFSEGTTQQLAFLRSPLFAGPAPDEILAWFSYDLMDERPEVTIFDGRHSEWLVERENLRHFLEQEIVQGGQEQVRRVELRSDASWPPADQDPSAPGDRPASQTLALPIVAINLSVVRNEDTLRAAVLDLGEAGERRIDIPRTNFHLRLMRDGEGQLRLVATRQVLVRAQSGQFPEAFEDMARDKVLVQGFFMDPTWLLDVMPSRVHRNILAPHERVLFWDQRDEVLPSTHVVQEIQLFDQIDIEIEVEADRNLGMMKAVIDVEDMKTRFRRQWLGFLGVTAVMAVSLVIGMGLLVRSVQASLEQARRTENFVASVTHELRTPVAAVKLYGEMLRDGWVTSDDKRSEYFNRIVTESDRLATLIDRVLLKRKLGVEPSAPMSGDLNLTVRSQIPELESAGAQHGDLHFSLAEDLPQVLLVHEGVHSVLVNLIENARKYARPQAAGSNNGASADDASTADPILVCTRTVKGKVVLEVSDRGPGIPESERSKIFDAFYRIGDERTRTAPGTGLGLHLVSAQAQAMKARVQVYPREGGGATFRVTFRKA